MGLVYYQTRQENGQWRLLDKTGAPFLSLGVNCVTIKDVDLSPAEDMYNQNRDWFPGWISQKRNEMLVLGFNTLGAWHHPWFWGDGFPKAVELSLSQHAAKVNQVWGVGFPDVFDQSFEVSIHKVLVDTFHGHGDSLLRDVGVIGYYTDNELHWWGSGGYWGENDQTANGYENTQLIDDFIALPPNRAGKKRWVAFLRETYGSIESLNAAWGSEYVELDDLLHVGSYRTEPEIFQRDKLAFLRLVAETYFSTTNRILKSYDSHRLNLGCRHVGSSTPLVVLEEGAKVVDIDSINFYSMDFPREYLDKVYALTQRPMMITEFTFSAGRSAGFLDSNNGSRSVIVASEKRRGECYAAFLQEAFAAPYILGIHWFALFDYGKNVHGLIGNYGLYDLHGKPYSVFCDQVRATHGLLENPR